MKGIFLLLKNIFVFTLIVVCLSGCRNNNNNDRNSFVGSSTSTGSTEYKYNSKSGSSYNYDISGEDEDGNSVYGNIDIDGSDNEGHGYIEDEYGNEKYVDVHWVGYGVLEGEDEDGVSYEFHVD